MVPTTTALILYPSTRMKPLTPQLHFSYFVYSQETKEGDQWVFECQHGPNECLGNVIMVCTFPVENSNSSQDQLTEVGN